MLIKINVKESVEIIEGVFVNVINETGSQYYSWDEMTESQQGCFSGMRQGVQNVYDEFKGCMTG